MKLQEIRESKDLNELKPAIYFLADNMKICNHLLGIKVKLRYLL